MTIKEIRAKSILRKYKKIDSWFITRYGMNLYRGCLHNCAYCDGRAEQYYIEGDFGQDISVKINAAEVLDRELNPKRKRKPLKPSYMMVGGGVGDSYGPPEKKYGLTRQVLQILEHYGWPVHILTKSTLVLRDRDILEKINTRNRAIVSFSFSSVDKIASRVFEPGVPEPAERLEAMTRFKREGFSVGMFLMPVIPFITDTPAMIDAAIGQGKAAGADFIMCSPLTLKDGRQKDHFLDVLRKHYPQFEIEYNMLFQYNRWGGATEEYTQMVYRLFHQIARTHGMATRIPPQLFSRILPENDRVIVMLEHMDHMLKTEGRSSTYGYAAHNIGKLEAPLSKYLKQLRQINGIGKVTESVIREILKTGTSRLYTRLTGISS